MYMEFLVLVCFGTLLAIVFGVALGETETSF